MSKGERNGVCGYHDYSTIRRNFHTNTHIRITESMYSQQTKTYLFLAIVRRWDVVFSFSSQLLLMVHQLNRSKINYIIGARAREIRVFLLYNFVMPYALSSCLHCHRTALFTLQLPIISHFCDRPPDSINRR